MPTSRRANKSKGSISAGEFLSQFVRLIIAIWPRRRLRVLGVWGLRRFVDVQPYHRSHCIARRGADTGRLRWPLSVSAGVPFGSVGPPLHTKLPAAPRLSAAAGRTSLLRASARGPTARGTTAWFTGTAPATAIGLLTPRSGNLRALPRERIVAELVSDESAAARPRAAFALR